jgi:hypothetical protein
MTIQIQSATYGVPGLLIDVTERVQLMAQDLNPCVVISNESMGGDPAVGHLKQLRVQYIGSDGKSQVIEGSEGSTVLLVDQPHGLPRMPQWRV